jgi:hypothetical protein
MVAGEGQVTPFHYHWHKMEDIVNRGGGNLQVQLYNATESRQFSNAPVRVSVDGTAIKAAAGTVLTLKPGESITLPPRLYHKFWSETGKGPALLGEISMVNDDRIDNCFYEPTGRFPAIEEDEAPLYLLNWEYPKTRE